ncbi:GNAT family N-acetyltransferase [Psychroserpens sp. Hel_I_66]|uniref:GNAT family N-acetyltransferase n=1 Tax=Psychroserpens sp. Hel_I_66 TaxID=1250004 RepID=UPI00064829CF|nr:GNAT family protein [Psychroserpens sp. Hel_I_66]
MNIPLLENNRVKLSLLTLDNYLEIRDVSQEKDLIQYSPSTISTAESLKNYVETAISGFEDNAAIPFIVYDKIKQKYAGSTRFGLINWTNKVLHIGWTWIGHEFQGSGLNKHIKYLMIEYAFEILNFEKVEFRIDERNQKSRKAVEKLGATLEGILRKDVVMRDNFRRNTCCYGILKEEWPTIKSSIFKDF